MGTRREAIEYIDERNRQLMYIKAGKKVPKMPGAPKLTEKDRAYLDKIKKEVAAKGKKK